MKALDLQRFCSSPVMGTFGRLKLPSGATLYTVELPWRGNQEDVSCIPVGAYDIAPTYFNRGGYDAIEVLNVPNRSHILFHKGNTVLDLLGCIAVGTGLGFVEGHWAVTKSKKAFKQFMLEAVDCDRLLISNNIQG